jgi:O-succinylbenzoic acid--CoA ligase
LEETFRNSFESVDSNGKAHLAPNAEASIIFTSGSSGHSKGVRLSVGNHLASAAASNQVSGLASGDIWLLSLPLYHVAGLEIGYRTFLAGASVLVVPDLSIDAIAKAIVREEITHVSLIPNMLERLLEDCKCRDSLLKMKFIMLGGAASSQSLIEQVEAFQLPVQTSYGMSETTSHVTITRPGDDISRVRTAGTPLPGVDIAILDDEGRSMAAEVVGEIGVRGDVVFIDYLGDSTHKRQRNGWFLTGDSGRLDSKGRLIVLGRKDDMIISGGENIHLSEIQAAIELHPNVSSCAVIGVEDSKWGQRPVLFFVRRSDGSLTEAEILEFLKSRLPAIKLPSRVIRLDSMPETAIGKIDYRALHSRI